MVEVVSGGDPLSEPAAFGIDRPGAEEGGVVVEAPDQGGVGVAQSPLRQRREQVQVWLQGGIAAFQQLRPTRQGSEAGKAGGNLGRPLALPRSAGGPRGLQGLLEAGHGRW